MPEGPSIVILREAAAKFRNRTVREVGGNSKLDLQRMHGRRVVALRSWGKHFLIGFRGFSLRAHLLMFGSWLIDAEKPGPERSGIKAAWPRLLGGAGRSPRARRRRAGTHRKIPTRRRDSPDCFRHVFTASCPCPGSPILAPDTVAAQQWNRSRP